MDSVVTSDKGGADIAVEFSLGSSGTTRATAIDIAAANGSSRSSSTILAVTRLGAGLSGRGTLAGSTGMATTAEDLTFGRAPKDAVVLWELLGATRPLLVGMNAGMGGFSF